MDKLNSIEDGIDRDKEFKKVKNGNVKTQVLEYQELYPFDKYPGEFPVRQYEVTSQFANRGFTLHTGNIN